jgi:hypothetical protein
MPGVLGLTLLVCVAAVGLTQLAVRGRPIEHLLGVVVVFAVAFPLLFAAPFAGVLLVLAAMWTRRLVVIAPVPDRIPPHWG